MDMGEVFGWLQLLLDQLGVWQLLGTIIQIGLVVSATMFVLRVLRG